MKVPFPQPAKILVAHPFLDGGYLRAEGAENGIAFPNPQSANQYVLSAIRDMGGYSPVTDSVLCRRTYFYGAAWAMAAGSSASKDVDAYWNFVEERRDTSLRFGESRGRPARQKGVDVLLAVDMLVGAVDRVFDIAILIAGDADFVPAVNEVKRRGISVVVAGIEASTSSELRAAADRFVPLAGQGSWALSRDPFSPPSRPLR